MDPRFFVSLAATSIRIACNEFSKVLVSSSWCDLVSLLVLAGVTFFRVFPTESNGLLALYLMKAVSVERLRSRGSGEFFEADCIWNNTCGHSVVASESQINGFSALAVTRCRQSQLSRYFMDSTAE